MKIKTLLIVGLLFSVANIFAQIPTGYYDGTAGLTGAALKTKLWEIIKNGHRDKGYDGLWTAYYTTDRDKYYEKDNSLLDMYSEKPTSNDSYNFTLGSNQCGVGGNYNSEGDCYNREHTIPQSSFNDGYPMRSDVHHVLPTDGYVNNKRGTYPYGVVTSSSWTSTNGSKLGYSAVNGYSGTVFEPIDEFKGDFARIIFYFATRYENIISNVSFPMFGDSAYPGISSWSLPMLLQWHTNDPVSEKEIDRNNAAYSFQGNRNPFIDHPEWVDVIWNVTTDAIAPQAPSNLNKNVIGESFVSVNWSPSSDSDVLGYKVYVNGNFYKNSKTNSAIIDRLSPSSAYNITVKAYDNSYNLSSDSNLVNVTTLASDNLAKDLLITKYIEGSSNNKALEITNLTNHEVDLKNYYLRIQLKGSTYYFSDPYELEGKLAAGESVVIINPNSTLSSYNVSQAKFVTNSPVLTFSGSQYIELTYGTKYL